MSERLDFLAWAAEDLRRALAGRYGLEIQALALVIVVALAAILVVSVYGVGRVFV